MNRPNGFKSPKDLLILAVCGLGVAAVAWWAWAAGPVEPNSALSGSPNTNTAESLGNPAYGPAAAVAPSDNSSSGASGQAVSSPPADPSGNVASPVMPPAEPLPVTPVYPVCHPCGGGAQPLVMCPYESSSLYRYPCCNYIDGAQAACGCGGRGTELLCASPL